MEGYTAAWSRQPVFVHFALRLVTRVYLGVLAEDAIFLFVCFFFRRFSVHADRKVVLFERLKIRQAGKGVVAQTPRHRVRPRCTGSAVA